VGKIVVTEFITIDGVVEEPAEWSFPYWGDDIGAHKHGELLTCGAMLLGRVTYEGFAEAWPERSDDFADRMNNSPKRVVSRTLTDLKWSNSSLIDADPTAIAALRDEVDGDVLVFGSVTLVRWLLEHHLVDELKLLTYPLALGEGLRLFADGATVPLDLIGITTFASGAVSLRYRPLAERPAPVPHLYS